MHAQQHSCAPMNGFILGKLNVEPVLSSISIVFIIIVRKRNLRQYTYILSDNSYGPGCSCQLCKEALQGMIIIAISAEGKATKPEPNFAGLNSFQSGS